MAENKIDTKSHSQPEAKPVKGKAPLAQDTEWDLPVAIREIAEKGVVQVKDASEKIRSVAVESTDLVEDIYLTATKGLSEFNLKALDALRTEPPRVCRRPFGLSYAAMAGSSSMA